MAIIWPVLLKVLGGDSSERWHYLTLAQLGKNLATPSESSPSWWNRKRGSKIKSPGTGHGLPRWDLAEVLPKIFLEVMGVLPHTGQKPLGDNSDREEIHPSVGGDENLFTSKWFSMNTLSLSGLSTGHHSQSLCCLVICFCSGNKLETLA